MEIPPIFWYLVAVLAISLHRSGSSCEALLLTGGQTKAQSTKPLYTVDCKSIWEALVMVNNDSYTLTGRDGCKPFAQSVHMSGGTLTYVYRLDDDCLHNETLTVAPKTKSSGDTKDDIHAFKVHCIDNNYGPIQTILSIKDATSLFPNTTTMPLQTTAGGQAGAQSTKPLYTVDCTSKRGATVTLNNDTFTLTGLDRCKPSGSMASGKPMGVFHLGPDCLPNKTLIVQPKTALFRTIDDMRVFQVECRGSDGMVAMVKSELSVSGMFPSPSQETHIAPPPTPDLSFHFLKQIPTTSTFDSDEFYPTFGETVYMTIWDAKGTDILIPKSCSAVKHGVNGDGHVLWNQNEIGCIKEPSIVKSQMTTANIGNATTAYLKIKAFKFDDDDDDAMVTFTCVVRVCSDVTSGMCKVDYDKLKSCQSQTKTNPAPPAERQRRQADNGGVSHGKVQHLTATLKVQGGNIVTGGSSIITNTLPCLFLSFLTRLML